MSLFDSVDVSTGVKKQIYWFSFR